MKPVVHHIPICPFCQRLEVLLELKGLRDAVQFQVVDITKPRDPQLLALTGGSTALPVLDLGSGRSLKESLVLMNYLEDAYPEHPVRLGDPYQRAVENLLVSLESRFVDSGYAFVMNQIADRRDALRDAYLHELRRIDAFLVKHSAGAGPWLFDDFGWSEAVYTPFFQRFVFIDYYEGVPIPAGADFDRVRRWRDACVDHPAAQQTSDEEVLKLYYDYARGVGNGALATGRQVSTFTFETPWQDRPMPPKDKYGPGATDRELGLLPTKL